MVLKNRSVGFLSIAAFFAVSFLFFPQFSFAQDALQIVGDTAQVSDTPLLVIIGRLISYLLGLVGIILFGIILYAGFLWMTAGGNADKVEKAKKWILNAIIGLIIIFASYAITSFLVQAITGEALWGNGDDGGSSSGGGVSVELHSGSLGSGAIQDHYPSRGATDVARNTKIYVTFKTPMNIESFIEGYDTNGTPTDVSDDIVAEDLNITGVRIYKTQEGEEAAFASEEVQVKFTDDLRTFVFDTPLLGSSNDNTQYTVVLDAALEDANGRQVLPIGGYEWFFTVGTFIDLTPPSVVRVMPQPSETYDRNIVVQMTFSEPIDPTTATGVFEQGSLVDDFGHIRVEDAEGTMVSGSYAMSNEYKTITFTTSDMCGTNSCGEALYCLPGDAALTGTIQAATPGEDAPQVDVFPYDGITDMAGNALDGNDDGIAGDDFSWEFSTTNNINLTPPSILSVSPDILGQDVALDQKVVIRFDGPMSLDTINSENIELVANPEHEMWYSFSAKEYNLLGDEAQLGDGSIEATEVSIRHGVFLQSTDEMTYYYSTKLNQGIRNAYQNCFTPAQGPDREGGICGTTTDKPYCCNGEPSSEPCLFF